MFVRCFCKLNVCLDEYELFARPRVAGHYRVLRLMETRMTSMARWLEVCQAPVQSPKAVLLPGVQQQ